MQRPLLLTLFILVALGTWAASYYSVKNKGAVVPTNQVTVATTTKATATGTTQPPSTTPQTSTTYTASEVAHHADATSCWTIIANNVYDVTSWINQHPGGPEAILATCGVDATAAFEGQHGGQRRPASELANFKIGALQ